MPSNSILVFVPAEAMRRQLETQLAHAGFAVTGAPTASDAISTLRDKHFDLIVAAGAGWAVSGTIPALRATSQAHVPLLVIAPPGDLELRIAFIEAGADDVIESDYALGELEGRIQALLIRSGRGGQDQSHIQSRAGKVIAFFSPKGGVGTTTLAVNTAVALANPIVAAVASADAQLDGGPPRVLLIDLDLQFGTVATHLNLTHRFDVATLCADEQALGDTKQAASYLTPHDSGIKVLAAPVNPEADFRIMVDQLERALVALSPTFDYAVVDCGSRLDQRTLFMLEQADLRFFVVLPEIPALRSTSVLRRALKETAALKGTTHFVVNNLFAHEMLKTKEVENLLRTAPVIDIPYNDIDMLRSVNEGVPVVTARPTSPGAIAIRKLVARILESSEAPAEPEPEGKRRAGLFARR